LIGPTNVAAISLDGIKLFADGASVASMLRSAEDPRISGFTTNPTLMRKAGVTDYRAFAREVLAAITNKPISFEVFADDFPNMRRQALDIATWAENVYVKIPVTTTRAEPSVELVRELSHAGVKVNVTAICTLEQVRACSEALRGGAPSVISVFAGRIADTGLDPIPHMQESLALCRAAGANIELLWASPREVLNVVQAAQAGVDIITLTDDLLKKLDLLGKDLGAYSLDTVQMFHRDATSAGYEL
jgi:transaldolase